MTATTTNKLQKIARSSDTVLAATGPDCYVTALDMPYGRILRTATLSYNKDEELRSLHIQYTHEYTNSKGDLTTFGHEAGIRVSKAWRSFDGGPEYEIDLDFASLSDKSIGTTAIRTLLLQMAMLEAQHIEQELA